ncbi:SCO family protein [Marinobacter sp. Arc7-DN-1]|uniref:SCO family protein n=1 Tax=Marinobacter sp. Arc7-DN-1 TaxID=2304594 RepID=UPI000E44A1E3|nr:SCO family protein [Marinobacter sp. Arc7-DN-1]AXS83091.1 SCO family protein [Marinobacter sp. Arc7-DN-1]
MNTSPFRRHTGTLSLLALILMTLVVSGCSGEEENWNGKDISGLMPGLEFELTDSQGRSVTAEQFDGKVRLLFFGFTSCPDVCPTALQKLNQATEGLPPGLQDDVLTLFVSVDPERDSPERLAAYVNFFGEGIIGLTGKEPQLRELAKRYRTTFGYEQPDENGNYAVSHSSAVYVFDREGKARLLIRPDLGVNEIRQDLIALAKADT